MEYLLLLVGLVILVVAGNYLVDSATGIARYFKLPTLIIGLTVVAFGTSAPELFVSLLAGFNGNSSMAIGNVVGSNCINVSVICGITALICPFAVARQSITIDTMFLLFLTLLLLALGLLGNGVSRVAGFLLFATLLAFTVWSIKRAKKEQAANPQSANDDDIPEKNWPIWACVLILVASIAGLSFGADLMVKSATTIAVNLGIEQRVIAVTVVALGTSLPELTASIMGALKGQSDLTVGNIVGSNIFNIGSVLGLSMFVNPIEFGETTGVYADQFSYDICWVFAFELMLLIGMINVTNNYSKFKKEGKLINLISAEEGLVGRIWGVCALGLYAYYVCTLLGVV